MKKILIFVCLMAAGLVCRAQNVIKSDNIGAFNAVTLVGSMDVELVPAQAESIEITLTGDVKQDQVTWSVGNNGLNIRVRPAQLSNGAVKVRVGCRDIEKLSTNGAHVVIASPLQKGLFTVDINSGAKVTAALDCFDLELRITGNSSAQLSGKARYASIIATQRSKTDARQLEAMSASAHANLGAEIYIWGTERVVAETNTGSSVFYRGEPEVVRTTTKLGGTINNIGK